MKKTSYRYCEIEKNSSSFLLLALASLTVSRINFDGTTTASRVTDVIICSSNRQLIFELKIKEQTRNQQTRKRE